MSQQTDKELVKEMVEKQAIVIGEYAYGKSWYSLSEAQQESSKDIALQLLLLDKRLAIRVYDGHFGGSFDNDTHEFYYDILLAPILNELLKEIK